MSFQHRNKLVAAGTEHRAVLEDFTNQLAGGTDILIPRLMSAGVVDVLQPVHIAGYYGKIPCFMLRDQPVYVADLFRIGQLAFHAGHGILKGQGLGVAQLGLRLVRPSPHDRIVRKEHAQREEDQQQHQGIVVHAVLDNSLFYFV